MVSVDLDALAGHTPGPWILGKGPAFGRTVFNGPLSKNTPGQVTGADTVGGRQICEADDDCGDRPAAEVKANARLIAAAPDLLAEVRALRAELESRKAVSMVPEGELRNDAEKRLDALGWKALDMAKAAIEKLEAERDAFRARVETVRADLIEAAKERDAQAEELRSLKLRVERLVKAWQSATEAQREAIAIAEENSAGDPAVGKHFRTYPLVTAPEKPTPGGRDDV